MNTIFAHIQSPYHKKNHATIPVERISNEHDIKQAVITHETIDKAYKELCTTEGCCCHFPVSCTIDNERYILIVE